MKTPTKKAAPNATARPKRAKIDLTPQYVTIKGKKYVRGSLEAIQAGAEAYKYPTKPI